MTRHFENEKTIKALLGPQAYVGDPRVRLAEKPFVTIQGEGPNAGKNTIFIRFFGCNLANSCGVKWCDSGHSFYTTKELDPIASKPDSMTFPNVEAMYKYVFEDMGIAEFNNVVFTGGEPLLWQFTIAQLLRMLRDNYKREISVEIETNGTVPIETDLTDWFRMVHFNISPKVHVVKNFPLIAQLNNCRSAKEAGSSFETFDHHDWCLKFVFEGEETKDLVKACLDKYNVSKSKVYLMPEGVTRKKQIASMAKCAEYCVNEGYNFSPRLHVLIWDIAKGV